MDMPVAAQPPVVVIAMVRTLVVTEAATQPEVVATQVAQDPEVATTPVEAAVLGLAVVGTQAVVAEVLMYPGRRRSLQRSPPQARTGRLRNHLWRQRWRCAASADVRHLVLDSNDQSDVPVKSDFGNTGAGVAENSVLRDAYQVTYSCGSALSSPVSRNGKSANFRRMRMRGSRMRRQFG
jgi:hypothetical protein